MALSGCRRQLIGWLDTLGTMRPGTRLFSLSTFFLADQVHRGEPEKDRHWRWKVLPTASGLQKVQHGLELSRVNPPPVLFLGFGYRRCAHRRPLPREVQAEILLKCPASGGQERIISLASASSWCQLYLYLCSLSFFLHQVTRTECRLCRW